MHLSILAAEFGCFLQLVVSSYRYPISLASCCVGNFFRHSPFHVCHSYMYKGPINYNKPRCLAWCLIWSSPKVEMKKYEWS